MSNNKEKTIYTMEHFIRTLKNILDTGTAEQKAKVVKWIADYIIEGDE